MHNLLETYLGEVAAHLSALPPARRTEELREMRMHLENAVLVGRELGRTEEEAIRTAVEQFGAAQDLGEKVVWAWRREQTKDRWGVLGAMMFAAALTFWPNLPGWTVHLAEAYLSYSSVLSPFQRVELELGLVLPVSYFLCGVLCRAAFPKWGVRGTAFTEAALIVLFLGLNLSTLPDFFAAHMAYAFLLMVQWVGSPLAAILGAWTFERWKGRKAGTRNLRPANWPTPPQDKMDRITKRAQ